jgi:hypothetical protein
MAISGQREVLALCPESHLGQSRAAQGAWTSAVPRAFRMPGYSQLAGGQTPRQKAKLTSAFLETEAKATVPWSAGVVGVAWALASSGLEHQPRVGLAMALAAWPGHCSVARFPQLQAQARGSQGCGRGTCDWRGHQQLRPGLKASPPQAVLVLQRLQHRLRLCSQEGLPRWEWSWVDRAVTLTACPLWAGDGCALWFPAHSAGVPNHFLLAPAVGLGSHGRGFVKQRSGEGPGQVPKPPLHPQSPDRGTPTSTAGRMLPLGVGGP